ncbi:hypothetical protein [Lentzea sp.]|uniref:hypothetical protein n=1 Tax=Lentzea sp. TaxID=56099 RepID=UPI002ED3D03A
MKIVTNGGRPDLQGSAQAPLRDGWPAFVLRDPASGRYRDAVAEYFPPLRRAAPGGRRGAGTGDRGRPAVGRPAPRPRGSGRTNGSAMRHR